MRVCYRERHTLESIPLGLLHVTRLMRMNWSPWWRQNFLVRFLSSECFTRGVTILMEVQKMGGIRGTHGCKQQGQGYRKSSTEKHLNANTQLSLQTPSSPSFPSLSNYTHLDAKRRHIKRDLGCPSNTYKGTHTHTSVVICPLFCCPHTQPHLFAVNHLLVKQTLVCTNSACQTRTHFCFFLFPHIFPVLLVLLYFLFCFFCFFFVFFFFFFC